MSSAPMKRRNIIVMLVLFLIPIINVFYWIFWWCSVQNQIKRRTGMGFGGFGHLLLTIFTFGIYPIYWHFVVSRRIGAAGGPNKRGLYGILYLVCVLLSYGLLAGGVVMLFSGMTDLVQQLADNTIEFSYFWEQLMAGAAAAWAMSAIGSIFMIIQMYVIPLLIQRDVNRAN